MAVVAVVIFSSVLDLVCVQRQNLQGYFIRCDNSGDCISVPINSLMAVVLGRRPFWQRLLMVASSNDMALFAGLRVTVSVASLRAYCLGLVTDD